jgi:hypothetical protein
VHVEEIVDEAVELDVVVDVVGGVGGMMET